MTADIEGLVMLRMLRVLKPLRSIKAIPKLQLLVQSLFASFVGLFNIYMFLAFILSFFAIFGVNMFSGFQYRACRTTPELTYGTDGIPVWPMAGEDRLCNTDKVCQAISPEMVCGSVWHEYGLNPNEVDHVIDNPVIFYGVQGFDNFWQALLTVF